MAINLNCNLNGGDSVTPNNELFYRIYGNVDSYASPIHTTGTAIADANVTVNGDVVDILNVDGTTNTSFKISAVDGAGNEGILSDAVSSSIIIFEDDFLGTDIDTNKWVLSNVNTSEITVTQSDKLIVDFLQYGTASPWEDSVVSIDTADASGVVVVKFDFEREDISNDNDQIYMGLAQGTNWPVDFCAFIQRPGSAIETTNLTSRMLGESAEIGTETLSGVPSTQSYKIVKKANGDVDFCYWGGSSWTVWHTEVGLAPTSGILKVGIFGLIESTGALLTAQNIDNLYLTESDFSTLNPI